MGGRGKAQDTGKKKKGVQEGGSKGILWKSVNEGSKTQKKGVEEKT